MAKDLWHQSSVLSSVPLLPVPRPWGSGDPSWLSGTQLQLQSSVVSVDPWALVGRCSQGCPSSASWAWPWLVGGLWLVIHHVVHQGHQAWSGVSPNPVPRGLFHLAGCSWCGDGSRCLPSCHTGRCGGTCGTSACAKRWSRCHRCRRSSRDGARGMSCGRCRNPDSLCNRVLAANVCTRHPLLQLGVPTGW